MSLVPANGPLLNERALATAAWAMPSEIAKRTFKSGDIWLGRAADDNETPVGTADDRHVLLVAGSRSGKGTSAIIPNLSLWPGSIVVIDPKGENATVTAPRRGPGSEYCDGLEQRVYVLDPFKASTVPDTLRATFNPLDALDPDHDESVDEAARLADAIVVSANQDDPFWDEQARTLIKCLILHIITAPHFEGQRSLITLRHLITGGDAILKADADSLESNTLSSFEFLFAGMRVNPAFHGIVARAGETFGNMQATSARTFTGVLSAAGNNTEFIDSLPMQRILTSSSLGFSLARLKTDPMGISVFLSLPQRFMGTHFRWLRMMVSLVITEMEKVPGAPASGHRVLLCLDEFANLKRLDILENAAAQIAGFGVKMFIVLQTLSQLKANYKDNWETFIGNAGIRIFFGIDDQFTREYISKYLGESEITRTTQTQSRTTGTSSSSSTSYGSSSSEGTSVAGFWQTTRSTTSAFNSGSSSTFGSTHSDTLGTTEALHKRALLTPDEVGLLFSRIENPMLDALTPNPAYPGLALVTISGSHPLIVRRTNYHEDAHFIRMFEPHPDYPFAPVTRSLPQVTSEPQINEQELENQLIAYYGEANYKSAIDTYQKLSYEAPGTLLVGIGPVQFSKQLLDEAKRACDETALYGESWTVAHVLAAPLMHALHPFTSQTELKGMIGEFGSDRLRKFMILHKKLLSKGKLDFVDQWNYYYFRHSSPILILIFVSAFFAFARKLVSLFWISYFPKLTIPSLSPRAITAGVFSMVVYVIFSETQKSVPAGIVAVVLYLLLSVFVIDVFMPQ